MPISGPSLVCPLHHYYTPSHLEHVLQEMARRGPPHIRAYYDGSIWFAREGTHRLRAAKALGLAPVLIPCAWNRTREALIRARFAAYRHGHFFPTVVIKGENT